MNSMLDTYKPKGETMNYKVLKDISLLTIAQAGPKDCEEFKTHISSMMNYLAHNSDYWNDAIVTICPGEEKANWFRKIIEWAERKPVRINWLIEKGFIEKVEELKPCPFCASDVRLVSFEGEFWLECKGPGFTVEKCPSRSHYKVREDAIKDWNRRP